MGHHRRDRSRPLCSAQAVIALRAFNRRFRLIRVFGQALSIHLALGFLIEGKAGVARRCRLRRASQTRFRNQVSMSESVVTESIVNTANPTPGSARNPMHAGGSDLRMLAQVEKWMAVIREITCEQQEPHFDIRGEPTMHSVSATVGPPHEIKIDESHRVLNPPASGGGYTFYVAFVVGLLATACGVAWFILYESALPFGLTSLTGNRDLVPKAISSGLEPSSNPPAARTPDTQTSDRMPTRDVIVREIAEAPQNPNISSASTKSVSTAPLSRLARKDSAAATVKEVRSRTKLTPAPETRPTTIEGWILREVVDGTAVIEGPNGVWKVTPGQTVPGVGRVDSIVRWGNRLIVATSSGLISTP